MRTLCWMALVSLAAAAGPLRYAYEPGEAFVLEGETTVEVMTRRGADVDRLAFRRAGAQHVTVCSREGERRLFAIVNELAAGEATAWESNGRDRRAREGETLAGMLPGRARSLELLELDDRGRGEPVPLDLDLQAAVLRVLGEVEVLPEPDVAAWDGGGAIGPVTWTGAFTRAGDRISAIFTLTAAPRGGARVVFDVARASAALAGGRLSSVEGRAEWTVVTDQGTERREIAWRLAARPGPSLSPADAADAAADAAPLAAAAQAWRTAERDRALLLWSRAAADPANRWAADAQAAAAEARAVHPALGTTLKGWAPRGGAAEGRWLLVYLWASWMPQCASELQGIAGLARGRPDLRAVAVARADALQSEEEIRRVFGGAGEGVLLDLDDGSAAKAFRAEDLPRVYLVDPEGVVRFSGMGGESGALKAAVERWIPE